MCEISEKRGKHKGKLYTKECGLNKNTKNKKLYESAQTYTFPQSLSELKALNIYLMFQMEEPLEPRSDDVEALAEFAKPRGKAPFHVCIHNCNNSVMGDYLP